MALSLVSRIPGRTKPDVAEKKPVELSAPGKGTNAAADGGVDVERQAAPTIPTVGLFLCACLYMCELVVFSLGETVLVPLTMVRATTTVGVRMFMMMLTP